MSKPGGPFHPMRHEHHSQDLDGLRTRIACISAARKRCQVAPARPECCGTFSLWSLASHPHACYLTATDQFPDCPGHAWHAWRRDDQLVDRPEVATVASLSGVLPAHEEPRGRKVSR